MSILKISSADFTEEVLKADKPVLVDFYADWCLPCKMMGRVLESVSQKYGYKIVKVNVDDYQELAVNYRVMSIPTMLIFKDGGVKKRIVGAVTENEVAALFEAALKGIETSEILEREAADTL